MFTGIITDKGEIRHIEDRGGLRRILIGTALDMERMEIGASVACNGCCLTVVEKGGDAFRVEAAAETLALTAIGGWKQGDRVNLEPSLRLGDELGGHMVSGHVDGLAVLESVKKDGEAYRLVFSVPDELALYMTPKGSVALNGISLTVNEVEGNRFGVCIIPHTWEVTNIADWQAGDKVHLEVDMLARYVARMLGKDPKEGKLAA